MKAKLSLILIPVLLALFMGMSASANSTAEVGPTTLEAWQTEHAMMVETARAELTATPFVYPTAYSIPLPTSIVPPYPEPEATIEIPPYPGPQPALEHKSCVIIPWLTIDGWKKREVCYPNR